VRLLERLYKPTTSSVEWREGTGGGGEKENV
jgi:hypothetical protein